MRNTLPVLASVLLLASWVDCLGQNQPTKVPSQQFAITDCSVPFQADVAGATYTVTQDLYFGSGDCIDVTAPGITINLNGYTLSAYPCGSTGISISKGASGAHILGGNISGRCGPNYGIHDMGDAALIENVTIGISGIDGIFLDAVRGSVVNGVSVNGVAGYQSAGIQLLDTDHCLVENSTANHNGYANCEGKPCGGGVASGISVGNSGSQNLSKNNFIVGNQANYNATTGISVGGTGNVVASNTANSNNTDGQPPGGWGIYAGGNNNLIIGNTASGNQTYDLYDSNVNCGTDHWVSNMFTTHNEGCVH